jgi:hypothetical protein
MLNGNASEINSGTAGLYSSTAGILGNQQSAISKNFSKIALSICASITLLGATASTAQAQIYGIKNASSGTPGISHSWLFSITPPAVPVGQITNPLPFTKIHLGGAVDNIWIDGLAIDTQDTLYAFVNSRHYVANPTTLNTADLVKINKTTGEAIKVDPANQLADAMIVGAAFDMDGKLWAINYIGPKLLQIDPANGTVLDTKPVTGVTFGPTETVDIAFDINNNSYITVIDSIYSIDVGSGAVTSKLYTVPLSLVQFAPGYLPSGTAFVGGMAFHRNGEVWFSQSRNRDSIIYGADISSTSLAAAHLAVDNLDEAQTGNGGHTDLAARPIKVPTSVPVNNPAALIGLALGMVGAGGMMLRRRYKQAR